MSKRFHARRVSDVISDNSLEKQPAENVYNSSSDSSSVLEEVTLPVSIKTVQYRCKLNQTVNDGVAHSRIGTLDQPVAA